MDERQNSVGENLKKNEWSEGLFQKQNMSKDPDTLYLTIKILYLISKQKS